MRFTFRDSETGLFKAVLDPRLTPTHLDAVRVDGPVTTPSPAPERVSDKDQAVRLHFLDPLPSITPILGKP